MSTLCSITSTVSSKRGKKATPVYFTRPRKTFGVLGYKFKYLQGLKESTRKKKKIKIKRRWKKERARKPGEERKEKKKKSEGKKKERILHSIANRVYYEIHITSEELTQVWLSVQRRYF